MTIECIDCGIDRPEQDIHPKYKVCIKPAVCGDYGTGSQFNCEWCKDWRPIDEYNYHRGARKCDECLHEFRREYGDE